MWDDGWDGDLNLRDYIRAVSGRQTAIMEVLDMAWKRLDYIEAAGVRSIVEKFIGGQNHESKV